MSCGTDVIWTHPLNLWLNMSEWKQDSLDCLANDVPYVLWMGWCVNTLFSVFSPHAVQLYMQELNKQREMLYTVELVCHALSLIHSSLHFLYTDVDHNMTPYLCCIDCCVVCLVMQMFYGGQLFIVYFFNGIHPVVLHCITIGVYVTVQHNKLFRISSINATCFSP